MKLLFCIKELHNSSGGAERVLVEVASGLAKKGHEIYFLSLDKSDESSFYEFHEKIKWIKLGSEFNTNSNRLLRMLRSIKIIRQFVKELKPDIAIGFMHSMYIPLGLSLIGSSIPIVASEHIVPEHYKSRPLQWGLLHITPFLVKKITCVSQQVKDAFGPFFNKKMVVVPNPVFIKRNKKADPSGKAKERKTLLTIGRLDKQKDQKVLISAFSKVSSEFPDWDLKIIGEGELRPQLEKQIDDLELSKRAFLPGRTRDVSAEYMNAQLFVLPSRYESFGLTLVEAMSYGLPTIGFDYCLGVNQLIKNNKNGILVDSSESNEKALEKTLKNLMADSDLRIKLGGFNNDTLQEHKLEKVVDQWELVLREVVQN
ncbi:MAG: glycosyltransferase family 4 protein [Hyphomicrobiales bacterium]